MGYKIIRNFGCKVGGLSFIIFTDHVPPIVSSSTVSPFGVHWVVLHRSPSYLLKGECCHRCPLTSKCGCSAIWFSQSCNITGTECWAMRYHGEMFCPQFRTCTSSRSERHSLWRLIYSMTTTFYYSTILTNGFWHPMRSQASLAKCNGEMLSQRFVWPSHLSLVVLCVQTWPTF